MRYLVAGLVALVAALLLVGVLRNPDLRGGGIEVPSDELLAYAVTPKSGVTIGLLQQTDELRLTAWHVVDKALPEERFDYSLRIEWQDTASHVMGESRLAFESRVSLSPSGMSPSSFAARLAYSDALVTDSRTVRVLVPKYDGRRPTQMRLLPLEVSKGRVLVRATFPDRRQSLEIAAVDQRLSSSERLEIIRDRTSVGYDDLPFALRAVALGTWQRRLDASGLEGKDYHVERLLIGTGRTSSGLVAAKRPSWLVHRQHSLALNFRAPVRLAVTTTAHSTLLLATSVDAQPRQLSVGESGRLEFDVGQLTSAQTVIISSTSEAPLPVQVSVTSDQLAAVLGPTQSLENSEDYALSPQLRRSSYYQLDPVQPVSVRLAPGQSYLGLTVRSTHAQLRGKLEADMDGVLASTDVELVPSTLEQWTDAVPATDGQRLFVRIPVGARHIALRGSTHLRVAPFTSDPDVYEDRIAPEYAVPLPPESRWKFARYDIERAVSLQPDNEESLVATGRKSELVAQSRIVGSETAKQQPEAALVPASTAVQRHVIEPVRWGPDVRLPEDVVVALERPRRGYVPSSGPRAGHVRVSYRLDAGDVGEELELQVDRAPLHRETTVASSGQFDVLVSPGTHEFALNGVDGHSQILLDATPIEASGALRRRVAYRIEPRSVLRFVVRKQVDVANVVITTYQQNERRVALRYAIEGDQKSDFLHAPTPLRGEISGIATDAPEIWYWETGPTRHLLRHRSVVTLGHDLAQGTVAFVLRNQNPTPTFVSLVLVGQDSGSRPALQRFWTTEEP